MNDGTEGTPGPNANAPKRRRLEAMLEAGIVMLHLDPRGPDVVVPPHLKVGPVLRLNIAHGFRLPALEVSDDGVYAILSFNRQNFACDIPWRAIFALTAPDDQQAGIVFKDAVPPELLAMFDPAAVPRPEPAPALAAAPALAHATAATASEAPPETPTAARKRPALVMIRGGADASESNAPGAPNVTDPATASAEPAPGAADGATSGPPPEVPPPSTTRPRPTLTLVKE